MDQQRLDIFDLKRIKINKSKAELEQAGKQLQKEVSSEELSTFVPVHRDPVAAIEQTEAKMIPELLPLRHQRMLASRFAFFRARPN